MKLIISLIFFMLSSLAFGKVQYFHPNSEMPVELKTIFDSYNSLATEKDAYTDEMAKYLEFINNNFSKLDREEILFISKSEIIKTVLKESPKEFITSAIPQDFLTELSINLKSEESQNLTPFAKWLITSLLADYDNLYRMKKNTVTQKRLDLIIPFLNGIRLNGIADFEVRCRDLMLLITKRLVHFSSVMLLYSSRLGITPINQKLAVINQVKPTQSNGIREIEDIISPIIEKHKKLGLPVPVDDWKPTEADFNLNSQVVNPSEKVQKPLDPSDLPKPVDDWNVEDLL